MAEHTRLKDLAADVKALQDLGDTREAAFQNTISQLQLTCSHIDTEHSRRMDRFEQVLRDSHRSLDLLHHKLESLLKPQQFGASSSFAHQVAVPGGYYCQNTLPRVKINFPVLMVLIH